MKRYWRGVYILWVALRYGLDELVLNSFEKPWLRAVARIASLGRDLSAPRGERLREALERLGPIFVKLGQVLSTRRDLMPADLADELAKLQDRVSPFSADEAVAIVERSFKKPLNEVYLSFDRTPIASASIAQVHFAEIELNGKRVQTAVKVLRPGMLNVIDQDLSLIHMVAGWIERLSSDGKRLKPKLVAAEFDKYLHDELDLMREAASAAQLRRNMRDTSSVRIPEMYWEWCRPEVVTMERMSGVPVSQIDKLREAGVDIPKLARDGVTIFFTQVFRDGFFHADMHPGNLLVSLDPQSFGSYVLLDFGIVGTLTEYDKEYLAQNFTAFFRRDYKRVAELHVESGWVPRDTRIDELESAIRSVCEPYFDRPLKQISLGMVLMRLFQTSRRFQVEIQPQLVLLQKTLLNVEGLGRQLDPDMDLWATAKPFLESWMVEQVGPKRFWRELKNEAPRYAQLLPELPRMLYEYLGQRAPDPAKELRLLAQEQRRTNRRLTRLMWVGVLALLVMAGAIVALARMLWLQGGIAI